MIYRDTPETVKKIATTKVDRESVRIVSTSNDQFARQRHLRLITINDVSSKLTRPVVNKIIVRVCVRDECTQRIVLRFMLCSSSRVTSRLATTVYF